MDCIVYGGLNLSVVDCRVYGGLVPGLYPANMYIWDPYGQNLGIYPIRVLQGPHIGFFVHIKPI